MQLSDISPFLTNAAAAALKNTSTFGQHLRRALAEINSITGESFAEDFLPTAETDWVVMPLAWILEQSATATISADTPEHAARVEKNYARAIEFLGTRKKAAPSGKKAILGTISGLYE